MAASPPYKVYSKGEYIASCKHPQDAAVLAGVRGEGSTVRYDHKLILWTEGKEIVSASTSLADATKIITDRVTDALK